MIPVKMPITVRKCKVNTRSISHHKLDFCTQALKTAEQMKKDFIISRFKTFKLIMGRTGSLRKERRCCMKKELKTKIKNL